MLNTKHDVSRASIHEEALQLSVEEIAGFLARNCLLQEKEARFSQKITRLEQEKTELVQENSELKRQLDFFKRQIFGKRSERFIPPNPRQLSLGELFGQPSQEVATKEIASHFRRVAKKQDAELEESAPRFDENVPVESTVILPPECKNLKPEEYEVISNRVTRQLAQKPGVYFIKETIRPVVKLKGSKEIICAALPEMVFERSLFDLSFLVCMLIDKFVYHLPLYRQHLRLEAAGIRISRYCLTKAVQRLADLLKPVYLSLCDSVRKSRVLLGDETPVKCGIREPGKMKVGYFWVLYSKLQGEIAFVFNFSRSFSAVQEVIGDFEGEVLLSDGYAVCKRFISARDQEVSHGRFWAHARRDF